MDARAGDATGTWKVQVKNNRGTFTQTYVFKQVNSDLTGQIASPQGRKEVIKDGKVRGDDIEFNVERRQPNGHTEIVSYKGKVKGDEIRGTFLGPGGHTVEWTARRDARISK